LPNHPHTMTISLTGFLLNFRDTTLADADSAEQHGRIIKAMGGRGKGSSTVDDYHAGSHPTCALVLTDRPRHDRTAYRRGFLPPVKVIGGHAAASLFNLNPAVGGLR